MVTAVLVEGRTKSEVARDYGVSRRWVQKLVARYQVKGEAGLEPPSRRPRSSPHQTPREVEARSSYAVSNSTTKDSTPARPPSAFCSSADTGARRQSPRSGGSIDDHSRLAVASIARPTFKAIDVVTVLADAFDHWGLPASVLTDNAAIFTGVPRGHGKVALEKQLDVLGIRLNHSRAYHPQTCGKVERSTRR